MSRYFAEFPRKLHLLLVSDPWVAGRKKKGKKKPPAKKRQSTQEKIDSLLMRTKTNDKNNTSTHIPPQRDAIERACFMKEDLLIKIERLGDQLPPNTLDQLIDELGGPENVAEVTESCYFRLKAQISLLFKIKYLNSF